MRRKAGVARVNMFTAAAVLAAVVVGMLLGRLAAQPGAPGAAQAYTVTVTTTVEGGTRTLVYTVTVTRAGVNASAAPTGAGNASLEAEWTGYGYLVHTEAAALLAPPRVPGGPFPLYQYGVRGTAVPLVTAAAPVATVTGVTATVVPEAGQATAAPGEYSTTNVQVAGVDEPDIVENNGSFIFVARGGVVDAYRAWPPGNLSLAASIDVQGIVDRWIGSAQLVLRGPNGETVLGNVTYRAHVTGLLAAPGGGLLVLASLQPSAPVVPPQTLVARLDSGLQVRWVQLVPGAYSDARLHNTTLILVTGGWYGVPRPLLYPEPRTPVPLEPPGALLVSGAPQTSAVAAIDAETGNLSMLPLLGVAPRALYVPASGDVYLALPGLEKLHQLLGDHARVEPGLRERLPVAEWGRTTILRLSASPAKGVTVEAHATVPGTVGKQWQLDVYRGVLRVVVTSMGPNGTSVDLYTFNATTLQPLGKLLGIAVRERIHGVRFLGDTLYLVTFRQVDPLFAIDLSDPRSPRVIGFLKAPGFDEYLHPLPGGGWLLGVGRENSVLRLTLYHLEDRAPVPVSRLYFREARLADGRTVEAWWSWSPVLDPRTGHRAFVVYPGRSLVLLPVTLQAPGVQGVAVVHYDTSNGSLKLVGVVPHSRAVRAAYIDGYGYSIAPGSTPEIKAFRLDTLETVAEAPVIMEATVKSILASPDRYRGRMVRVAGVYMGWKAGEAGPPPVTRSDWVLEQDGARIYVAATRGIPGDPVRDAGKLIVEVVGRVEIASNGRPYIDPVTVTVIGKRG